MSCVAIITKKTTIAKADWIVLDYEGFCVMNVGYIPPKILESGIQDLFEYALNKYQIEKRGCVEYVIIDNILQLRERVFELNF
jgi:hypothetical protein